MVRGRLTIRVIVQGLGIALLAGAGGMALLFFLQDWFIYHPLGRIDQEPSFLGLPFEPLSLRTADGETIGAWLVPAEEPVATVLFLHGNAGNRGHRIDILAALRGAGLTTLIIDYRGYGDSTGRPSEEGLLLDAGAAWSYLTKERDVPAGRIVLYGESLGSVPALALAAGLARSGRPGPGAIILEGAFTSALAMGRRIYPFLPMSWILRARMDNLATIENVPAPTMVIHGGRDEIVPIEMGRALVDASPAGVKQFVAVPGAGHNTVWWSGKAESLGQMVRTFVLRALAPAES